MKTPMETYADAFGDDWAKAMARDIPAHMHDGVVNYVVHGITPGDFLTAVIEGNLFEAARRADDINKHRLWDYARFLITSAPAGCFGSKGVVREWCAMRIGVDQ